MFNRVLSTESTDAIYSIVYCYSFSQPIAKSFVSCIFFVRLLNFSIVKVLGKSKIQTKSSYALVEHGTHNLANKLSQHTKYKIMKA